MAKKIIRDDVSYFHDYDIHIASRTLFMGSLYIDADGDSGTDAHMAERMIKGLHILDHVGENGDKPINIIMNNPGGSWYHGMAIFNAIEKCKNHVTITVIGSADSMGSIILQSADERILAKDADIMIHFGSDGYYGHTKTFEEYAKVSKRLTKRMEGIYIAKIREKNPKYKLESLRKLLAFDTVLSSDDAVALGLADKIL